MASTKSKVGGPQVTAIAISAAVFTIMLSAGAVQGVPLPIIAILGFALMVGVGVSSCQMGLEAGERKAAAATKKHDADDPQSNTQ